MTSGALRLIERVLLWWVRRVHLRPRLALAVLGLLAVAGLTIATTTLKINTDASDMIDKRLPYRQAHLAFEQAFPALADIILVVVRAPSPDEADAFTERLSRRLEQNSDHVEAVYAPTSFPLFQRNGLLFLNESELDDQLSRITKAAPLIEALTREPTLDSLFDRLARSEELLSEANGYADALDEVYTELADVVEARLAGDPRPLSWQRLFRVRDDGDGDAEDHSELRVISVTPKLDFTLLRPAKAAIAGIEETVAALKAEENWDRVEVGVTGNPALRSEELQSVSKGIGLSFGLSFIAVAILLWFALRSYSMVFVTLLTLIVSLSITAGFAALTVGALNLISIAFTVLLIGLGIDFAIHFGLHVLETRRRGSSLPSTLEMTVHEVGGALALAAPTTAFAFFAFVPTQFVGMAQLGIISGTGVLIAFVVAVTALPAAAAILPPPRGREMGPEVTLWSQVAGGAVGKWLAIGTVVLGIASLALLPSVRFDADPMGLRNQNSPSVKTFSYLFEDENTTPYRLNVLADTVEEADTVAEQLDVLGEVGRTITISDFIPDDQDTKIQLIQFASGNLLFALDAEASGDPALEHGSNTLKRLLDDLAKSEPDTPAQRLYAALRRFETARIGNKSLEQGLQADVFRFWGFQMDRLRNQLDPTYVSLDTLPESLVVRFLTSDGKARVEVSPASDLDVETTADRRKFVESIVGLEPEATGSALNVLRAGDIISASMLQATLLAGVVVLILLWILLRDVIIVGLILLPVILAGILTSAAGVLLDMPYNFANVIVIPLLIGLGADNGIHLALRARQMARHEAVFATTTPRAVFYSALTTIASFGALALSDHRGTASMGALLTIALGFTLLCTLLVLPSAMAVIDRRRAIK